MAAAPEISNTREPGHLAFSRIARWTPVKRGIITFESSRSGHSCSREPSQAEMLNFKTA